MFFIYLFVFIFFILLRSLFNFNFKFHFDFHISFYFYIHFYFILTNVLQYPESAICNPNFCITLKTDLKLHAGITNKASVRRGSHVCHCTLLFVAGAIKIILLIVNVIVNVVCGQDCN
jgi:hypothetical protein